jgi:hypothetical protein
MENFVHLRNLLIPPGISATSAIRRLPQQAKISVLLKPQPLPALVYFLHQNMLPGRTTKKLK